MEQVSGRGISREGAIPSISQDDLGAFSFCDCMAWIERFVSCTH